MREKTGSFALLILSVQLWLLGFTPYNSLHCWFGYNGLAVYPFYVVGYTQLEARWTASHGIILPSLDRLSAVKQALHWTERQLVYCGYRNCRRTITHTVQWNLQRAPAVMDMVADSQDEPGSGGSALFSDISTPTRSWNQVAIRQESKQRDSPPRRPSSSPATPRASQKGREVDIERWEIQIAHECRVSRSNQREEQDGDGDRGVPEDD